MKKIWKYIVHPKYIIMGLSRVKLIRVSDKFYVKCLYEEHFNKSLNLKNPQTYNEKLQWLKLYDRNPEYTKMVDKYEVKNYVSDIIGEEYVIPTLGVYNNFNEIDFDKLPNQFVIKCTHDSGGIVICKDKNKFNKEEAKNKINKCLKNNFFYAFREWPYKNIKPRIIIEKYMTDESGIELKDYKFFCFNGEPKLLFVAIDRPYDTKFNFYDMNFKKLPFKQHYENFDKKVEKPKGFDKMIELSKKLSKNIPHVRVDFYDINGQVFFGEMTFYHFGGIEKFEPEEWDYKIGNMLKLPKIEEKNEK